MPFNVCIVLYIRDVCMHACVRACACACGAYMCVCVLHMCACVCVLYVCVCYVWCVMRVRPDACMYAKYAYM